MSRKRTGRQGRLWQTPERSKRVLSPEQRGVSIYAARAQAILGLKYTPDWGLDVAVMREVLGMGAQWIAVADEYLRGLKRDGSGSSFMALHLFERYASGRKR